jgi:cation transport protein ChaC
MLVMWAFGYGSLMSDGWEAKHRCIRRALADIHGYCRAFNKKSIRNWGTRENPCPTLNLVEADGASCRGVAFQFADQDRPAILEYLTAREGKDFELRTIDATLVEGDVISVTVPMYRGHNIIRSSNASDIVPLLLRARGRDGSGIDYLNRVADDLDRLKIIDAVVDGLRAAVTRSKG